MARTPSTSTGPPPLPAERPSRAVVESLSPAVGHDDLPAKASVGEPVPFEADVFTDGHDLVAADAVITTPSGGEVRLALTAVGNDRHRGTHRFTDIGRGSWHVEAWIDHWSSWIEATTKKHDAGLDVAVELKAGRRLVRDAEARASGSDAELLLRARKRKGASAVAWLDDDRLAEAMRRNAPREPIARSTTVPLVVERERARFSAWYEFFPRSTVEPATPPGTLRTAVDRLDHVASLGFDIVYLPPIHPIGVTARKGPNNSISAGSQDPGSPWAIGSPDGGHTDVHPDLGTIDDVRALVEACHDRGMELALDIAFQCSPDHPWVRSHPEWFERRPDGTIQYAENPPKRYQDIYPLDFESEDWTGLWEALRDVFLHWCEVGVRVFRVDNPHTKAFAFWEWVIPTVQHAHPDTLFLSEAFTRPRVMQRLAKLGFSQSYTYFPWRHGRDELREYLTETSTETIDWFRPNSWPNTPDILTEHLQQGGRAAAAQRVILAATLTANYGVYGPAFELVEHTPVAEGSEEYLDSEKYQIRTWDLDAPHSLAPLLRLLNEIRSRHPALQWDRTLRFHDTDDPGLICYSKTWPGDDGRPDDRVLVVVNLDPHLPHQGMVHLDLPVLGLGWDDRYVVEDLIGGSTYEWEGAHNFVALEPDGLTAHVFDVRAS